MRTEPTRVLHVIKGLGPGGAERLLVALARAADAAAVRHRVAYVVREKSHLADELVDAGAEVDWLGRPWVRSLRRLIKHDRPHVVHAHSPLAAAASRLAARTVAGRPVTVSTEHNRWAAYHPATRLANALTYALDVRHLAVSEDARTSVWAPLRGRTEVLDHGVDVATVAEHKHRRQAMRAALGVAANEVLAVAVANYRAEKDLPTLLAAARLVADGTGTTPVRFAVVGQGPLQHEVEEAHRRLGLEGVVDLLGYRPDAVDVMAAADLFVLSSRHEGLPVAVMEALALGLPVVATAVGGIPRAVADGREGVLVPPARPDALAAAIVDVAGDPVRRRSMGEAAAAKAAQFDVARVARRLERLYAEVRR